MNEQLTAIIIKGKVHRLTVIPDDEPCICMECSLRKLCDSLDEHVLCDFIGGCRGHSMFKCDEKKTVHRIRLTDEQFIKLREAANNFVLSVATGWDTEIEEGKRFDDAVIEHIVKPFIEPLINNEL